MKKPRKTSGGAIRPARSPVIAIRVPTPVHAAITKAAKDAGLTISEYVARLIARGEEWTAAIGDASNLLAQARAEARRIVGSTLEAEHRRHNWKRNEKGWWAPPEAHGLPANGFTETKPTESAVTAPKKRRAR